MRAEHLLADFARLFQCLRLLAGRDRDEQGLKACHAQTVLNLVSELWLNIGIGNNCTLGWRNFFFDPLADIFEKSRPDQDRIRFSAGAHFERSHGETVWGFPPWKRGKPFARLGFRS